MRGSSLITRHTPSVRVLAGIAIACIFAAGCAHESPALPGTGSVTNVVRQAGIETSAAASASCEHRVNDTREKLEACIAAPSLWQHLAAFQTIADKNPGPDGHPSRQAGTPGYKASVDYVAGLMRQAGYKVQVQAYQYNLYADTAAAQTFPFAGRKRPASYPYKGTDYNLIADSPYGPANRTVIVEGHLDSFWGAGMLDNASGSATILQIALALAKTHTQNHLRFIWFGGEELGLLGSRYYTQHLTASQLKDILYDVDVDVSATPNFDILIADTRYALDAAKMPSNVASDSQVGSTDLENYFSSIGVKATPYWYGSSGTDSNSFGLVGVPNTGMLTMQDCCRHDWEVKIWGGYTGDYEGKIPGINAACSDQPLRWCDNLDNNDPFVFRMVSKAIGVVTLQLANDGSLHR